MRVGAEAAVGGGGKKKKDERNKEREEKKVNWGEGLLGASCGRRKSKSFSFYLTK